MRSFVVNSKIHGSALQAHEEYDLWENTLIRDQARTALAENAALQTEVDEATLTRSLEDADAG